MYAEKTLCNQNTKFQSVSALYFVGYVRSMTY